jgi:hypothetical protein
MIYFPGSKYNYKHVQSRRREKIGEGNIFGF